MPVGGGKFTLEKTWRASGTGTTTFNAPGNFTLPFGKSVTTVQGRGGTGNPLTAGNLASYNSPSGGNANYNTFTSGNANYNSISPSNVVYNPISGGNPNYNAVTGGNLVYNAITPGNPNYNATSGGNIVYNAFSPGNPNYNAISGGNATYNAPSVQVEQWTWNETYGLNYYDIFYINPSPCPTPFGQFDGAGGWIYTEYVCTPFPGSVTYNAVSGGNIAGYNAGGGGNFAGYNAVSGGNIAGYNAGGGGNFAGYNAASGGNIAGYNTISGGNFAGYNAAGGGNIAGYNASSGGNIAGYNATSPGSANYNPSSPAVPGTPSSALGVSMTGGTTGTGTFVGPTQISTYAYPDNQTYPVTVGSGGYVQIEVK